MVDYLLLDNKHDYKPDSKSGSISYPPTPRIYGDQYDAWFAVINTNRTS